MLSLLEEQGEGGRLDPPGDVDLERVGTRACSERARHSADRHLHTKGFILRCARL
jgi:hypothetical protein